MNKWVFISIGIVLMIVLLFLPIVDETSSGTLVVIDHSTGEIIHPDCFEHVEKTNWLDEVSYERAKNEYEYKVTNACSKQYLGDGKTSIVKRIFK